MSEDAAELANRHKREAGLAVIEPEPRGRSVIELLEETLERARNGEISAIAIASVYPDGTGDWAWSELPGRLLMLGSVARMHFALARECEDE